MIPSVIALVVFVVAASLFRLIAVKVDHLDR
jgi:hypothetical protein